MAKGPKRRNFAFDSLQVLSGQFAMMAIGIVNGVITARWLGPADRDLAFGRRIEIDGGGTRLRALPPRG